MRHVLGRDDVHLSTEPSTGPSTGGGRIPVTRSALSGVALWPSDERPDPGVESLGWLSVPAEILDTVAEETRIAEAREAVDRQEIDTLLRAWERDGELDHRLVQLADWVERVETVYLFIGRAVFSKSDAGSNTLTRDALLQNLRNRSVDSWRPADRLFVVLAHCLFRTGRSVRFEEFNGRQVSAGGLREFLLNQYAGYCAAVGREPGNPYAMALFDLAEAVRDLLPEVDRSPAMRYRRVNGLTFVKNERLADFPLPREPVTMPEPVARFGREHLGVTLTGDVRGDLGAMTSAAAVLDGQDPGPGASGVGHLGELLGSIVLSAVVATDSDYGMSSSIRDLTGLRGAQPGGPDGVLALKKGDFFCCCLPHTERMAGVGDDVVPILWRSAQRMMYNRWHFAPGEFDRADIPLKRHYFFPPQVPDIGEHADHHHGGHVASRVRFTLRAPGAQVWRPPFTVFGNGFRGCYDIRLVRMEGPAYTTRELAEAVRHCSLVDAMWRTLAEGVQRGTLPTTPIVGFDRAWYASRGWERWDGYRASTAPPREPRANGVTVTTDTVAFHRSRTAVSVSD